MSLPVEIWAHILQYLPLAKIHQMRQVSSTLDNAAELVLGDIYRKCRGRTLTFKNCVQF